MAAIVAKDQVRGLVVLLVVCLAASGVGGVVKDQQIGNWYATLAKPSWNPPDWVFVPVWSAERSIALFCKSLGQGDRP